MSKTFSALKIKYDVSNNKTQSCLIVADPDQLPPRRKFYKVTFDQGKYVSKIIDEAEYNKHLKDQSSDDDDQSSDDDNVYVQKMEIKSFGEFKKKFKGIDLNARSNTNSAGGGGI